MPRSLFVCPCTVPDVPASVAISNPVIASRTRLISSAISDISLTAKYRSHRKHRLGDLGEVPRVILKINGDHMAPGPDIHRHAAHTAAAAPAALRRWRSLRLESEFSFMGIKAINRPTYRKYN